MSGDVNCFLRCCDDEVLLYDAAVVAVTSDGVILLVEGGALVGLDDGVVAVVVVAVEEVPVHGEIAVVAVVVRLSGKMLVGKTNKHCWCFHPL